MLHFNEMEAFLWFTTMLHVNMDSKINPKSSTLMVSPTIVLLRDYRFAVVNPIT